jgi:hypothetical protein
MQVELLQTAFTSLADAVLEELGAPMVVLDRHSNLDSSNCSLVTLDC